MRPAEEGASRGESSDKSDEEQDIEGSARGAGVRNVLVLALVRIRKCLQKDICAAGREGEVKRRGGKKKRVDMGKPSEQR